MALRPAHETPAGSQALSAPGSQAEGHPSAELRVERSLFSRWLARFGLGESTNPILRPTKPSAERAPNG